MTEIWQLEHARTRSVSPENPTGAKGSRGRATEGTGAAAARELGQGWKVSPSIDLANKATATLADLAGPGVIRHLGLTTDLGFLRCMVLRMYWEDEPEPSVEVPLGDFFCNGWGEPALVNSDMVVVAPAGGLNSYWPMPFRGRGRITLENLGAHPVPVYYQITYTEHELLAVRWALLPIGACRYRHHGMVVPDRTPPPDFLLAERRRTGPRNAGSERTP